ncbi:MAG TPA: YbbR-like domain-containing protein [Longimicrobiales bacterium]|mgnify:CR=1 FL=1|nr:YbbR-like domain-containing protein [Longimicrobiales bacterium]
MLRLLLNLLTRNLTLKLTALVLAILLWTAIKAEAPMRVSIPDIAVEVAVRDPRWHLAAPPTPATVTVVFTGPVRELVRLASERPRIVVPIEQVSDSMELRQLQTRWVQFAPGFERTRAEDVRPATISLLFERLTTRVVPLHVSTRGDLPEGYELAGAVEADPVAVRVSGPRGRVEELDVLPLPPVDLAGLSETATITVAVDTTGLGDLVIDPMRIRLTVPVRAKPKPDEQPGTEAP